MNDSPEINTMNEAKHRGVFLAEYKAFPSEFYLSGQRFVFYNIWTERAWNLEGPCRCKLVFKNPYQSPYHFNMYLSESFYWYMRSSPPRYIVHIPFDSIGLDGTCAIQDSGQIHRRYVYKLPPDTLVVSVDSVISARDSSYKNLLKVLFVKVK